jgi:hypothetical protein
LLQTIDLALAGIPNDARNHSSPPFVASNVNLQAKKEALSAVLGKKHTDKKAFATIAPGMSATTVLQTVGMPEYFSLMVTHIAKDEREKLLTFHYVDAGLVTFNVLAGDDRHWVVGEVARELVPVKALYTGDDFPTAQALASWRGIILRDYALTQDNAIESKDSLGPVLLKRLLDHPTPQDAFEDRGLAEALELIYDGNGAKPMESLQRIAATNTGTEIKEVANDLLTSATADKKRHGDDAKKTKH